MRSRRGGAAVRSRPLPTGAASVPGEPPGEAARRLPGCREGGGAGRRLRAADSRRRERAGRGAVWDGSAFTPAPGGRAARAGIRLWAGGGRGGSGADVAAAPAWGGGSAPPGRSLPGRLGPRPPLPQPSPPSARPGVMRGGRHRGGARRQPLRGRARPRPQGAVGEARALGIKRCKGGGGERRDVAAEESPPQAVRSVASPEPRAVSEDASKVSADRRQRRGSISSQGRFLCSSGSCPRLGEAGGGEGLPRTGGGTAVVSPQSVICLSQHASTVA